MLKILSITILIAVSEFCFSQQSSHDLQCITYGFPDGSQTQYNEIGYKIDNTPVEYNGCSITPAIMVAIIDTTTCTLWNNCNHTYGQANEFILNPGSLCSNSTVLGTGNCRNRPENYFIFHLSDSLQVINLVALLNAIPDGNYVLIYTWYTFAYNTLSTPIIPAMANLVSTSLTIPNNVPFILFCLKGPGNSMQQVIGSNMSDTLSLNTAFTCSGTTGTTELTISDFHFSPNPVSDFLHLQRTDFSRTENIQFRVFDSSGRIVLSGKFEKQSNTLEVSALACGFFILNLRLSNGKHENYPFIKQDF